MTVATKKQSKNAASLPDNAIAQQALEAIKQIERDAQSKRLAQLEALRSAKAAILERLNELNHQLAQIDKAVSAITGEAAPTRQRAPKRDLQEIRERVGRWMEGRRGQKFGAGDLEREFPELEGVIMSVFLKPLVENGKLSRDVSAGIRRTKYFVADGA